MLRTTRKAILTCSKWYKLVPCSAKNQITFKGRLEKKFQPEANGMRRQFPCSNTPSHSQAPSPHFKIKRNQKKVLRFCNVIQCLTFFLALKMNRFWSSKQNSSMWTGGPGWRYLLPAYTTKQHVLHHHIYSKWRENSKKIQNKSKGCQNDTETHTAYLETERGLRTLFQQSLEKI